MATLSIEDVDPGDTYTFTALLKADDNSRQRQYVIDLPPSAVEGKAPSAVLQALWDAKADEMWSWTQQNEGVAELVGSSMPHTDLHVPEWDPSGVQYEVDDEVKYEGTTYVVLQAHTSQSAWTPPSSPSLFEEQ